MKVTRETDYAIRIVSFLSKQDSICGAKLISEETNITQRFALKILRKLCIASITKSFKGNLGGYTLNVPPKDITMLDVIEAIQGEILINNCAILESSKCNDSCSCTLKKAFASANLALTQSLSSHTFDNL